MKLALFILAVFTWVLPQETVDLEVPVVLSTKSEAESITNNKNLPEPYDFYQKSVASKRKMDHLLIRSNPSPKIY